MLTGRICTRIKASAHLFWRILYFSNCPCSHTKFHRSCKIPLGKYETNVLGFCATDVICDWSFLMSTAAARLWDAALFSPRATYNSWIPIGGSPSSFEPTKFEAITAVAQWLRCCATNRKVAGSIPDGVIGIFHWHNPPDHTMALGSTQPLTEMSTRRISWG